MTARHWTSRHRDDLLTRVTVLTAGTAVLGAVGAAGLAVGMAAATHPKATAAAAVATPSDTGYVDAGTAGWKMFWDFKEAIIDRAKVRILAFLNIASNGMMDDVSEQTPVDMKPEVVASVVQAYPDILVGIKTAHYWTNKPWDEMHSPWASVERAVQAGELCGKPVMVDFWPRPPEGVESATLRFSPRPSNPTVRKHELGGYLA